MLANRDGYNVNTDSQIDTAEEMSDLRDRVVTGRGEESVEFLMIYMQVSCKFISADAHRLHPIHDFIVDRIA